MVLLVLLHFFFLPFQFLFFLFLLLLPIGFVVPVFICVSATIVAIRFPVCSSVPSSFFSNFDIKIQAIKYKESADSSHVDYCRLSNLRTALHVAT